MILGLGTDVCRVERVEKYLLRHGDRFKSRVFTPGEVAYCERHTGNAAQFAARVAAKEAAAKALGTGFCDGVSWKDFEVAREPSGKPTLRIHGRAAELASKMGVRNVVLSMSHDAGVALAVVIFEGE